jgi:uncharacterized RDD family membrane protein YckC
MTPADLRPLGNCAVAAEIVPSAGLGRRWCALVYEGFLLAAVLLIAGFAALPLIGPVNTGTAYSARQLYVLPWSSSAFLSLFYVAVAGVYCIFFWSNGRRTLAMKTWGLALATGDGRQVDVRHATKRYLGAWIGPAAGLAGFVLFGSWGLWAGLLNYYCAWIDRDRQFLHDRIAGTRIVRLTAQRTDQLGSQLSGLPGDRPGDPL